MILVRMKPNYSVQNHFPLLNLTPQNLRANIMVKENLFLKDTLRDIPLFSELEIGQLREITEISMLKKTPKNRIIFLEGDPYVGFYIVLKGSVKVFKSSVEGKEVILHIIKPPFPFADVPLFEGGDYPASAQALEESVLLFIPKNDFIELLQKNPSLSLKIIAGFAKRLKKMSVQIEEMTLKEVTNRLAKYLYDEINKNGNQDLPEPFLKLTVSKTTIASLLGTVTETLSRTLKKLQNEKIIRVNGKTIFVSDYARLKELAK